MPSSDTSHQNKAIATEKSRKQKACNGRKRLSDNNANALRCYAVLVVCLNVCVWNVCVMRAVGVHVVESLSSSINLKKGCE